MFHGDRVLVLQDEKVRELDGGDDCTTMQMRSLPQNVCLKIAKMANSGLCPLNRNFKK